MNTCSVNGQNFGTVYIRNDNLIKKELANSTASFKDAYERSLKAAKSAQICDVVLSHDGKVIIYNNKDRFSTEIKGFSTPLKNFFMALKTVNMIETMSEEHI